MIRHEGAEWVLYDAAGDKVLGRFTSEQDAKDREAEILRIEHAREADDPAYLAAAHRLNEFAPVTSDSIEARPFLIDGVALSEQQIAVLANMMTGRAMYAGRAPMELPGAVGLWRRRNHITAASGKPRWTVHSASPTWRESLEEATADCAVHSEIQFVEAAPDGSRWDIVLIREGWSKNARYYPREVLIEAAERGLFNCDIYAYGWRADGAGMGHLPGGIRDTGQEQTRNKVGWTTESRWSENAEGRVEIAALFHWADPVQRSRMVEAWRLGNRSFLGFSIDGGGSSQTGVAEGRRGAIVTKISHLSETTLVSDPAAGGRFERLVAAATPTNKEDPPMKTRLQSFLRARLQATPQRAAAVAALDDKPLCEASVTHLKEMGADETLLTVVKMLVEKGDHDTALLVLGQILDAMGASAMEQPPMETAPAAVYEAAKAKTSTQPPAAITEAEKRIAEAEKRMMEREERIKLSECATLLERRLGESKLALPAQGFIRKQFSGIVFDDAKLLEAIDDQKKYLAEVMGGGEVRIPGAGHVLRESRDKLHAGLHLAFGFTPAKDDRLYEGLVGKSHSIKEIYGELTGDYDVTGRMAKSHLQEATTVSIANLLGTSMEKALVQNYRELPDLWANLASVNPDVKNFKTQTRVRWDGWADLATVAESTTADYDDASYPSDAASTYAVATYGALITITRRMIKNDDLQTIRDIPRRWGRAAKNKLNRFVHNLAIGNDGGTIGGDNMYDGIDLFHASHFNLATTAISHTAVVAARRQLENQYEYGVNCLVNGASFNNLTDPVTVTVDTPGTTGFFTGGFILVDSEICRITAVPSATTMTVARAMRGTTAAAHADNAQIFAIGSPLPISRFFLVAPFELRGEVEAILGSEKVPGGQNNDYNFLNREFQAGRIVPHMVSALWLGGDVTNWYLVADPNDIPSVEVAFMDNRQEPELWIQDGPTEGNVFTRDNIRYKMRHEYGGVQVDWRGLQGNLVAG